MFAVIYIPDFSLQAVLRHEPELTCQPVALIEVQSSKTSIIRLTQAARKAGIVEGMTPTQALARCREAIIRTRSLSQETVAGEVLARSAFLFSPRVELTAPGVCTLDLKGLKNVGDEKFGRSIIDLLSQFPFPARVGAAATPELAWLAAQFANPFQAVQDSTTFLSELPVASIVPSMEVLGVLERWGTKTLGAFVALGKERVAERLGSEALELFDRASPETTRPLKLANLPETFEEIFEFENAVESIEPLLFILRRFLNQISCQLELIYQVVEELKLRLSFAEGNPYEHVFRIPSPTCNVEVLFRMLYTHLESLKTEFPVVGLYLSAKPCRPAHQQFHLFEATLRDPNHFFETLGRLEALFGADRVGRPVVEPTYRPDAFKMEPITLNQRSILSSQSKIPQRALFCGLALRRFRPPQPVKVQLNGNQPVSISSSKWKGKISGAQGPWRSSGSWWEQLWDRFEWDIQCHDGRMYRLVMLEADKTWFLDGIYD